MVSKEQEREFEKNHILRQKDRYLETDVLERVQSDGGYRDKLELIERFLREHPGAPVLDLGANTAGEAEVLASRGHEIVATDINEIALGLSKQRANSFGRSGPTYYAGDAHRLPFQTGTFRSLIAFEVLHHFEELDTVLAEIYRVLKPGGSLFAYEPFALNPYRRIAELRFVVMGSIERSFTVGGLRKQLEGAGFSVDSTERHVLPPSEWKKRNATRFRAALKDTYYEVGRRFLPVFGNIVVVATKPGGPINDEASGESDSWLECPITGHPLERDGEFYVSTGAEPRYRYPIVDGIPVLIAADSQPYP